VIEEYRRSEGHAPERAAPMPLGALRRRLWQTFEYPETSRLAFVVAVVSVVMTLVSIVLFCVETLPAYAE
jgi:hypothetical protein